MAKAVNARGIESSDVATFAFFVPAPFWRETWFAGLLIAFVSGVGAFGIWLNGRRRRLLAERRWAEEALVASERKYHSLFDTSRDGIDFTDLDGRIEDANAAFLDMLGYTLDELRTMTYQQLTPAKWAAMEAEIIERQVMTRGYSDEYEKEYIRRDGSIIPVMLRVWLVHDDAGKRIRMLGMFRDMTERKRIEAMARQRQAELAHMSRLNTMGEMAAGLAHELNQPLAAIANYANGCLCRMDRGSIEPADIRHALGHVAAQAARTGEIIRRTREFLRRREPHRSGVDINALIRDAVKMVEHEVREIGLALELDLRDKLPKVLADSVQIQQVVLNLVRNSLEALKESGTAFPKLLIQTSQSDGEQVEVTTRDNGPGVPPEFADHIFNAFFTSKPGGMGMGLPISRSIIEEHGGKLSYMLNYPYRGSMFRFTLPAVKETARNEHQSDSIRR
jgi:PAS domain S-box-containing protein